MSYKCDKCEIEFNSNSALQMHISIAHPPKVTEKSKPKKRGLVWRDGKRGSFHDYVKRMRQTPANLAVGDVLTPKEARKLLKHDLRVVKRIKGARLKVVESNKMNNGVTRYRLENKKIVVIWAEGYSFKNNPKSKLKRCLFLTKPAIWSK